MGPASLGCCPPLEKMRAVAFGCMSPSRLGGLNVCVPDIVLGVPGGGVWRAAMPPFRESSLSEDGIVTVENVELVRVVCG